MIYNVVSRLSHKLKHIVKSALAVEITTAFEGTELGKEVAACYRRLLNADFRVHLAVDSKDLSSTISTEPSSIDRSVRGDAGKARLTSATNNVCNMSWITGRYNLADVLKKNDSPLTGSIQVAPYTG